uniref:protein FAM200C-like n=1 Tax=Myxine glutinosa TaxID=7769 RepID=UPI00358FFEDB
MSKKRKYDDSYIKWGFMKFVEKAGTERPQCVLCYKVLAEASMKPSKLKAHLASTHPTHQNDSEDVFQSKKARFMAKGSLTRHGFQPSTKPILEASYEVALLIAKDKKAHTIGETLVKPCAVVMANLVCGPEEAKKLKSVPLCNNTIKRRIEDMSKDIVAQVTQELRESRCRFSLQLDESTDVASCSQLLVFARYLAGFAVKKEFLFCSPLKTTTKSVDIMNIMNHFMEENGIEWTKLGSLCTDGAPAMMGKRSGFVALVKDKCPDVIVTHCVLHRHALATKTLPKELGDVMAIVVTAVNFIRARALNHRLFQVFCEDIGAAYTHLLYYTEVRWLSRGQILNRVLQLRQEIEIFLREKGNDLADYFGDPVFVARLVYISDIFGHLNALNISLQGSSLTIFEAAERINSLREKLRLWSNRVEKRSFVNFPELAQILADDDAQNDFCSTLVVDIKGHLKSLSDSFDGYFPNLSVDPWIQDPFTILIDDIDDDNELKDDLIELKASGRLKMQFSTVASPSEFWASNYEAFPNPAAKALRMTLPFVTTYLCEAGFSALVVMKTKLRARLDVGPDMRVALSKTAPRIKRLVEEKQEHPSHRV